MKLEVTYWRTADLRPYPNNTRTHSAQQITQIADSIRKFGFTNPILIDPHGGIIAGEGRWLGAQEAGEEQVPCIVLAGLSEREKRAYVIADNKIAENSGWNYELLSAEINDLIVSEFPVEMLGFTNDDLTALLSETAGVLPNAWTTTARPKKAEAAPAEDGAPPTKGRTRLMHTCPNCGTTFN